MVRALLNGTKTQTRRAVKHECSDELMSDSLVRASLTTSPLMAHFKIEDGQPREFFCGIKCPYGQPGDRLYVRETWGTDSSLNGLPPNALFSVEGGSAIYYRADDKQPESLDTWRPSIHMPRAASRLLLEITAVRCERVQDISEADAVAEGVDIRKPAYYEMGGLHMIGDHNRGIEAFATVTGARAQFAFLINTVNHRTGPNQVGVWESNPWVWVVEFKVVPTDTTLTTPNTHTDVLRGTQRIGQVTCLNIARPSEPAAVRWFGANAAGTATGQAHASQAEAVADVVAWADGQAVTYQQQAVVGKEVASA
jgi:hypothetical protein